MKKRLQFILLITILLLGSVPIVSAQTYSGFNTYADNIKLLFSNGDNKVKLALEIREKEVNSALENIENGNTENAIKNLEKAQNKLKIVQEKISLATSEEVKTSVDEITNKINEKENLPDEFKEYLLEEEITQLTAELTLKTFEYCKTLAQEDFALMLKEEICNPDTAAPGLEKELEELKYLQLRMFVQLMLEIRSCIDDPGTCNCEANVDVEQKVKCEKMVALAIKCEYKNDETACNELKVMGPKQGDSFAESFVPDFLMNLFREKSYMVEYGIEPSDGVPEECWDENDKPECEQYEYLKETKDDWDEYGNFIGKRPKDKTPTMRESIPQCFDENDNFLEEKCGKITMVENEDGLINYLIEKDIDGIINNFENKSEQNTIDINGTEGQTMVNEMKTEINEIKEQIAERTFAPGTKGTGEPGKDIKNVVVEKGKQGPGDGGLKPEIKTDVAKGNDGLTPEVKTAVASSGHEGDNIIDSEENTIDQGENTINQEINVIDENEESSNPETNDLGGVDEGPGEPGEVNP
ncbi:MAG: hypothetical protein KKF52_04200 [Nanoarchaeota archaeon]|nr:hypothetical protein [Nanoarchaeota archaeon]